MMRDGPDMAFPMTQSSLAAEGVDGLEDFVDALKSRITGWPLPLAYPADQCLRWPSSPASLVNWSFQLYGQSPVFTRFHSDIRSAPRGG